MVGDGRRKLPVAGCRCVKGALKRKANFRLFRDGDLVHTGKQDHIVVWRVN